MTDGDGELPAPHETPIDARTVIAHGERLAVVETKLNGVQADTGVIRATIHDINNRMTEFVAAEILCGQHLAGLLNTTKDIPELVKSVAALTATKPELDRVISESQQRLGIMAFGKRLAMIAVAFAGVVGVLGGVGGFLIWLSQHLKPL